MASPTEAQIIEALKTVKEPESGKDLITLNMVSGLVIKDGNVGFSLEVHPDKGAAMEPVRQAATKAVNQVNGVASVTAVLTAHRAASKNKTGEHPKAQPQRTAHANKQAVAGVKNIIAVASGKGGVGKSTVAVNLALAFNTIGLRTALLDADIYGPSQPRMMGLAGEKPSGGDGEKLKPIEKYGLKLMSMGFLVEEETPMIWRGPMVMSALQQFLRDVEWGDCDIMIVDMPPGTGDAQLTLAQQVPLAGAVIVSTPQDIALIDARKGLNMFRKVEIPVLGIIENMSYFLCPNCDHQADIFGHGGASAEAEKLDVQFLGEIPLHMQIRETSDGGAPVVVSDPGSVNSEIFLSIASKVWAILEDDSANLRPAPSIIIEQ
ncbi:MAG: iron-sulfur cluster carrier protein ApbC [Rhodospirillaceae bacterium]|nr:iron-sulfur cluster carrier protein ApbC [Rhodospirillaceae bacterium]